MREVIGVTFRSGSRIYNFDPKGDKFEKGAGVIVRTSQGLEMGTVICPNHEIDETAATYELKPIMRPATDEECEKARSYGEKEKEAYKICKSKIAELNLDMKLVAVEYAFDASKILFYFTAENRVDFRSLVSYLANVFHTRIELRQIGVRDEARMIGGYGICGRCLCCTSCVSGFSPVSIKMAKEQNLSLNPAKISGVCGRLMCCLKNEAETYEHLNAALPRVGDFVLNKNDDTRGKVSSIDVLRQKVKVIVSLPGDDLEIREYPASELSFKHRRGKNTNPDESLSSDEVKALEMELDLAKEEHARAEAAAAEAAEKRAQESVERIRKNSRGTHRDVVMAHLAAKASARESVSGDSVMRGISNGDSATDRPADDYKRGRRGRSRKVMGTDNADGGTQSGGNRKNRRDKGRGNRKFDTRENTSKKQGRQGVMDAHAQYAGERENMREGARDKNRRRQYAATDKRRRTPERKGHE